MITWAFAASMFRRFCAGDGRLAGGAAGCLGDDRLAGDASAFARLGDARFAGDRDARPGDAFSCEPFDLPSVTVALGDFSSVTCSRHASSAFSTSLYFSNAAVALPRSQPSLTRCSTSETTFVTCAGAGLADCCWRLGFALPDGEACWTRLRLGDRCSQPLPIHMAYTHGVYTWPMHMAYTHGLHTCLFICLYTWPIHMVTIWAEHVFVVTARRLPLRGCHLRSSFADGPDR